MLYATGAIGKNGCFVSIAKTIDEAWKNVEAIHNSVDILEYTKTPVIVYETLNPSTLERKLVNFLEKNKKIFGEKEANDSAKECYVKITTKELRAIPDSSIAECKTADDLAELVERLFG